MYVGWAGSDALQGAYAGSNLKGIIEASTIRDFISTQLPKLMDQASARDPNAPEQIAKLQSGLGIAWHHPVAFYFEPMGFNNPRQPDVHMGLICDAGPDAVKLSGLLNDVIKQAPPSPDVPVTVSTVGNLVSLVIGKPTAATGSLATNPSYVKAMKQINVAQPAIAVYGDVQKGLAMVQDALQKIPDAPPEVKAKFGLVVDAVGIGGMRQMVAESGFDGKGWTDQSFVGYTGEKKGIWKLVGQDPITDADLAVVPKEAAAFTASKMDLHALFTEARTIVGNVDANAGAAFDQAVQMGGQQIGIDIEKDLLAPLGTEWILYRAPLSDEGGLNIALVHKLSNPDQLAKTISTLENFAARMAQGRFKIDKVTTGKIEVSSVSYLTYSIAWTVRDGYLFVSSLDGIAGAVKQVENKKDAITQSDLYKTAMAQMPKGVQPLSISYSNPARIYPELRRMALGVIPLARAAGVDIPPSLLPDTDDVAKFMTPGAAMSWMDAEGAHAVSHSSFLGAEMLGGDPSGPVMVAVPAMLVAVALPATARARTAAGNAVDASNLKQITTFAMLYSADHNGKLPDSLARIVSDDSILTNAPGVNSGRPVSNMLARNGSGTQPLNVTPELQQMAKSDFNKFSDQVTQHSDYIYIGDGFSMADANASQVIIAYSKPGPGLNGGINAAYLDGHVQWVPGPSLAFTFQATNDARRQKKLPEVDVQTLMQQLGVVAVNPRTGPRGVLVPVGPAGGMP